MKKLLLFALLIICTVPVLSQNWDSVKADREYLWGEGSGSTVAEADKVALNDLISKIAIHISSTSSHDVNETVINGSLDSESQFKSTMQTYAQASLNNTEKIVIKNEPNARVGRWIKRTEINKIFASRKVKIKDLIEYANRAEENGKIDDALRYYYWALILTKSLQYPNDMTYDGQLVMTWIPKMMNQIFDELKIAVVSHEDDFVELYITYKDKPINSIDYTYFDGRDWSNIYSAKDGKGVLELASGNVSNQYMIKYEYEYRGESRTDQEIQSVMNVLTGTPMRKATVNVSSRVDFAKSEEITRKSGERMKIETFSENDSLKAIEPILNQNEYNVLLKKLVDAIRTGKYGTADNLFNSEGLEVYNRLVKYGNAKVVGIPAFTYYNYENGTIARGLQMAFSFKSGVRKAFVEDVVFTFDEHKKISNIAFGLGSTAENDILYRGAWDENTRKAIMNFLENYKTAYALKRLDYIRSIFDDDAVIIIGNVVKKASSRAINAGKESSSSTFSPKGNNIIRYNRYTKDAYLRNLEHCFDSNEFINLRFSNNEVRKMAKGGELYAIQIQQDYYSSTYNDQGYLFLEVDINNPQQPSIILRTWQPEKDPSFGLYGPGDF